MKNKAPFDYSAVTVNISLDCFANLQPFVAVDDIRHYLNGIYVEKAERGGVYVVACDGHALAVMHDPAGSIQGLENCILKASEHLFKAVKAAKKVVAKDGIDCRAFIKNERVMLGLVGDGKDLELYVQAAPCFIEGNFPDWKAVLPKDFEALKPGAATYVMSSRLLAAAASVGEKNNAAMCFWQESPEKALVCQYPSIRNLLIILMPMRNEFGPGVFDLFTFEKATAAPLPGKQPSDAEPVAA